MTYAAKLLAVFALLTLCASSPCLATASSFPFVIPWNDSSPSPVGVSSLGDGPAGNHGFIIVRKGHFVESGTGKRVRFLAVNMAGADAFPTHADAQQVAARLQKYGVNLVRLHHTDNDWSQTTTLVDLSYKDRRHIDSAQLDRFDYLIYQLKQHGIYSNINLHIARTFSAADGFDASVSAITFGYDKRVDYFDPRMIALEKEYARSLLTHVNPYTHKSYCNEPAILNAELTNEDSLLGDPRGPGLGTGLADMPEPFLSELRGQWNKWLADRYKSATDIESAWTSGVSVGGESLLRPWEEVGNWTLEQDSPAAATLEAGNQAILEQPNILKQASDVSAWYLEQGTGGTAAALAEDNGELRASVTKVDGTAWHVQFSQAGLTLEDGKSYTLDFVARADQARPVDVFTGLDQADWHNTGLTQTLQLTTTPAEYQLHFTASACVPGHVRLAFSLGQQTGDMWLQSVSLREDNPVQISVSGEIGPALKTTVSRVDGTDWHIQIIQSGLTLEEGKTYTVSFMARADGYRSIGVGSNLDQADWHGLGLSESVDITPNWRKYSYMFTARDTVAGHARLSFSLGQSTGPVWLADIRLQEGIGGPIIGPGQSAEAGDIPVPADSFGRQQADWLMFLSDTEQRYAVGMRAYLKNTLGFKPLVICSQVSFGGLAGERRETAMDFADNHAYWQHPGFPHKPWDPIDWNIPNTSMVLRLGSGDTLSTLAAERIAGMPYTVSEYNHPAPNDYQAEAVPLLASFASFQDWDAIYLFDYGAYGAASTTNDRIDGFFGVGSNPAKWAFFPAAALLLREGLIPPPAGSRITNIAPYVSGAHAYAYQDTAALYSRLGLDFHTAFKERLAMSVGEPTRSGSAPVQSNTGDYGIFLSVSDPTAVQYIASSSNAAVVVGFVGHQPVEAGDVTFIFGRTPNQFASVVLVSKDSLPLARSSSILLTLADRVQNTGMQFNDTRNSVGDHWGTPPTIADLVPVSVWLRTDGNRQVFALNETGKPSGRIPSSWKSGTLSFTLSDLQSTMWYWIRKP